jgi:hypothetical protein
MTKTTDRARLVRLAAATRAWAVHLRARAEDERGEGVISMAIAILIVSFLGVAAWLAFKGILDGTEDKVQSGVEQVGR